MNELTIPEAAQKHWFHCGCEVGCHRAGYQNDALPLIVAAELRRLADGMRGHIGNRHDVVSELDERADELDGGIR